jgi:hypothetical protein
MPGLLEFAIRDHAFRGLDFREDGFIRKSMIRKKLALGLDPRVDTGFPKRSCSIKMLERQLIPSKTTSL